MIFPVKFIMTNYSQNKNNYFENLTGELCHLKWANPHIKICPINIVPSILPYKDNKGVIKKFEKLGTKMAIYGELVKHDLCDEFMNYIINVEYQCHIGDKYSSPSILGISPHITFREIFIKLGF